MRSTPGCGNADPHDRHEWARVGVPATLPCAGVREVGPVETAVEADLGDLGMLRTGQAYLAASARKLARVIDARGDDEAASTLAKAVDTLRAVMNQLMARESSDPNELRDLGVILSTPSGGGSSMSPPLRYPKVPKPANAGSGGGRGRKGS